MKKVLILAVAIVMCASLAFAQGGHLGLYSDVGTWVDCNIVPVAPPTTTDIYLVHKLAAQANGSQFAIQTNTTMFFSSTSYEGNLNIGSTPASSIFEGMTVTYVGCKPLPHVVAKLAYFNFGYQPCEEFNVVPDPTLPSGEIEVVDCNLVNIWFATGGKLTVDGNESCPCQEIATEKATWSKIKSLYQ